MEAYEETLRKLSVRDDALVGALLADDAIARESRLDEKTRALVRVGALIAVDAAPPSYLEAVTAAAHAGATADEIVGRLIAVLPAVGVPRVVSAAPKVGLALGYDVDAALEEHVRLTPE